MVSPAPYRTRPALIAIFNTSLLPDGSRKQIVRRKGEYALAAPDALPHLESGGATGGTVILSMNTGPDGVLFEYLDENLGNGTTLTIAVADRVRQRTLAHPGAAPAVPRCMQSLTEVGS